MAGDTGKLQGEGDYEAARNYRRQAERHADEKDVAAEARAAEKAKDGAEGATLTDAEAKAKARARAEDPEAKKPS